MLAQNHSTYYSHLCKVSVLFHTVKKYILRIFSVHFQCINELDELLNWFDDGDKKLKGFAPVSSQPKVLDEQLKETKVLLLTSYSLRKCLFFFSDRKSEV